MSEFIPVPGFEEYKFNAAGKFLSKRNNDRILSICKRDNWYATVKLRDRHRTVHRLLAIAFIPNPNNYPMVNHIDGDKHNYSLDNLEWCTNDQNMKHAQRTGLLVKGRQVHTNILDEIQVKTIFYCREVSDKNLAKYFGIDSSNIYRIRKGDNWKHLNLVA